jgi:hypothetical protein
MAYFLNGMKGLNNSGEQPARNLAFLKYVHNPNIYTGKTPFFYGIKTG